MLQKFWITIVVVILSVSAASCIDEQEFIGVSDKIPNYNADIMSRAANRDDVTEIVVYGYTTCENKKKHKVIV